ncbi:uncharacterized protein LOC131263982 [Anopheles coustani]|uniref:uncharacterized protein LOC131263982 n=1 Tax=Anopheles coustani TaxID=139045 RepID=UPI00265ADCA7|nr:uncharacterized protein LOC131263982 [Anopheles coustani]
MGGKETKMLTPLDIGIKHIKLDDFDAEESIVDHLPEPPQQTTAAPGRLLNLEQSSIALSWGRLDTTGSIAGELEDGASSPSSSAINEVVGTDDRSGHSTFTPCTRRRGTVAVHNIANKTGPQSSERDKNGCNQLGQDPYDLKNIANDGDFSEGKTQGRKKRVAQKPKAKSPLPSLVKRICYNRATSSNKKSCDSTDVAKVVEDIDIAEDSDDSWQPDRKKPARLNVPRQPTKRTKRSPPIQKAARPSGMVYVSSTTTTTTMKQGRRVSVTNVEKSTFVPQQEPANTTQEEPDDSLVEVLQQIRENPIFDAQDSSTGSFGNKRKSPPGRCLSYGSTVEVVPSESIQPGTDMVPASFSILSFEQASVDNGQSGTKLQYVLDNIVAPGVEELARSFGKKMHEANNYYEHLVASCDPLFKAMAEKHALYLQQEQAASRTLDEFLQLAHKYKKARPTETELEKRIAEAAENERLFKMQLTNERNKFKNVIDEAAGYDWNSMKKSYANIIQGALFGND